MTIHFLNSVRADKEAPVPDFSQLPPEFRPTPDEHVIFDTSGEPLLEGLSDSKNFIVAGPVATTIIGGARQDRLFGNASSDIIRGNSGNDQIASGPGNDILFGDAELTAYYNEAKTEGALATETDGGDDLINGGEGDDEIWGGAGDDRLFGEAGDDYLHGGTGNRDVLAGNDGNDILNGGSGAAKFLFGNAGDDRLMGAVSTSENSGDIVYADGGDGQDTLYLPGNEVNYSISQLQDGRTLYQGSFGERTVTSNVETVVYGSPPL
jgi:Ca2+-binding RTX toxin-like protein